MKQRTFKVNLSASKLQMAMDRIEWCGENQAISATLVSNLMKTKSRSRTITNAAKKLPVIALFKERLTELEILRIYGSGECILINDIENPTSSMLAMYNLTTPGEFTCIDGVDDYEMIQKMIKVNNTGMISKPARLYMNHMYLITGLAKLESKDPRVAELVKILKLERM